jgi:hypothetical protein
MERGKKKKDPKMRTVLNVDTREELETIDQKKIGNPINGITT